MKQSAAFLVCSGGFIDGGGSGKMMKNKQNTAKMMKMNKNKHVVQLLFFILAAILSESVVCGQQTYYVSYSHGKYTVHQGEPTQNWITQGIFRDTTNSTG